MAIDIQRLKYLCKTNLEHRILQNNKKFIEYYRSLCNFIEEIYIKNSVFNMEKFCIIKELDKRIELECNTRIVHSIYNLFEEKNIIVIQRLNNQIEVLENFDIEKFNYNNVIIYYFDINKGEEKFIIDNITYVCEKSPSNSKSIFLSPTYEDLNEALDTYYNDLAKYNRCYILEDIWNDDYLVTLKPKPENIMRKSLAQYLKSSLRNIISINEETNVTPQNPVDISLLFANSVETAYIEIKWLGKCGQTTTEFSKSRIKEGSKQLCDYILEGSEINSKLKVQGYFVVFDARRNFTNLIDNDGNIIINNEELDNSAAYYYQDSDEKNELTDEFIKLECKYHRFFLVPKIRLRKFSSRYKKKELA